MVVVVVVWVWLPLSSRRGVEWCVVNFVGVGASQPHESCRMNYARFPVECDSTKWVV